MKKLLLFLSLFAQLSARGQDVTENLSWRQADSLARLLKIKLADSIRIDILLKLTQYNILKPGSNKSDLDSATRFFNEAANINSNSRPQNCNGYVCLVKAYLFREKGDKRQGKQSAQQAIELLKPTSDKYHLGEAYYELAQYYEYNDPNQAKEKIQLVEQSAKAFQQSGHVQVYAFTLKNLADLYDNSRNLPKALENAKLSLQNYNAIHYQLLQGIYIVFSSIYYELGDYQKSLHYEFAALKAAENTRDTTMQLCEITNLAGVLLLQLGETQKALNYFKRALQIAEKWNDRDALWIVVQNIISTDNGLHKSSDALAILNHVPKMLLMDADQGSFRLPYAYLTVYFNMKRYREGQFYCNLLVEALKHHTTEDWSLYIYDDAIARFYIASGQIEAARIYAKKTEVMVKKLGATSPVEWNYMLKFELDTAERNYLSAIGNLLTFQKMHDSLLNETKSRQIKQMEVEYETEQKEGEIILKDRDIRILNQKNELQQNKLQQALRLRNETLAAIFALLVSAALFFRQYRQKQRTNQIITTQNADITRKNKLLQHLLTEKEWLLKEVHHRVKNNLHTVICLLESQAAYLENDALKAIETSQHRIYAMSLIHQKLYQSDDVKAIEMSAYLPEFISYLKDTIRNPGQIQFLLNIESLSLDVSQAIPIALIVNEAVTNSVKYAFPDHGPGIIEISMHQSAGLVKLLIADNGIGIDPRITDAPSDSLGIKLIKGLSQDINADITIENDHGTKINLSFDIDPLHEMNNSIDIFIEKNTYA